MKFGLVFPNYGKFCSTTILRQVAPIADEHFHAFVTWDHFIYQNDRQTFDAFALLCYLASQTKTVRLATCVTPLVLRGPVITAKLLSSLDILSGGRAILGVGAGWFKKEFELLNAWKRASDRVKATEHAIIKLKSLLNATGDEAVDNSNDGKFPCIQTPHPPIWVGTKRKIMLRVATKHANGWIPTYMEPKEYAQRVEDIESNIAQRGGEFTYCSHYSTKIGRNNHNVITFIESMKNAGCEFMAIYPQGGVDEYLNNLGNLVDILSTFQ